MVRGGRIGGGAGGALSPPPPLPPKFRDGGHCPPKIQTSDVMKWLLFMTNSYIKTPTKAA